MREMTRQIVRKATAALSVLALVLLSFGIYPFSYNNDGLVDPALQGFDQITLQSICGDNSAGHDPSTHGPCHACRLFVAEVPRPTSLHIPVDRQFERIFFVALEDAASAVTIHEPHNPRAPPIAV